jgi:hypothetical protein
VAVNFIPRIFWPRNDLLLPPEYFGIFAPKGLGSSDLRYPNIVDVATMMRLTPNTRSPGNDALATVDGLVTADLSIRFKDPASQWRKDSVSGSAVEIHFSWRRRFSRPRPRHLSIEIRRLRSERRSFRRDLCEDLRARTAPCSG